MRLALVLLLLGASAQAQDLGHKILGGVGLDAGVQNPPGIYLADRLIHYQADQVRGRTGALLPIQGFNLDALGIGIGLAGTFKLPHSPYVSFAIGFPVAHIRLSADNPRASLDRAGFGDLFIMPFKVGGRLPRGDLVASFALYAPTGLFEPRSGSGVGRGHFTYELSWGGALFLDSKRRWRVSALTSWDLNGKKRGLDLTRGQTLQIQGGAGATVRWLDLGVAGFALWQISDDLGSQLPQALRGARDRAFGVGPELGLVLPSLRTRVWARYEWELGVESRPEGQVLSVEVAILAWKP